MNLRMTLLTGVATACLASPAFAGQKAPDFHLAISKGGRAALVKSHVVDPKVQHYTQTATFSATISTKTDYNVKTTILGETWYSPMNCSQPKKESWTGLPAMTAYATISTSTSTGTISSCSGTTFTFQDIDYTLTTKKAKKKTDVVMGNLVANKFNGYDLKLVATVDVAITK